MTDSCSQKIPYRLVQDQNRSILVGSRSTSLRQFCDMSLVYDGLSSAACVPKCYSLEISTPPSGGSARPRPAMKNVQMSSRRARNYSRRFFSNYLAMHSHSHGPFSSNSAPDRLRITAFSPRTQTSADTDSIAYRIASWHNPYPIRTLKQSLDCSRRVATVDVWQQWAPTWRLIYGWQKFSQASPVLYIA